MLIVFAIILCGIFTGRLLIGRRLAFVSRLITAIIWLLLFLLGAEVGGNPAVVGGMATLGATAFVVFVFSVAGSIVAAWWLGRRIGAVRIVESGEEEVSFWQSIRGSLVIVAFFAVGCGVGLIVPLPKMIAVWSVYVLYALMFCVGVTLGNDRTLVGKVRELDRRLAWLPVMTAIGTLGGAAAAALFLAPPVTDLLAVGAGFGYYSLSSIFIADMRGAELATVALLCNVMRELFTLLFAPLVARCCSPLAAVSIGGATTFDTTLPIITQAAGRPYAVVSVVHGVVLDFSVPFLVTLFCSI